MKTLSKEAWTAYRKYKELGEQIGRLTKAKEEVKALIEEGFGRASQVETPEGTILYKQEIERKIKARVDHFFVYKEKQNG